MTVRKALLFAPLLAASAIAAAGAAFAQEKIKAAIGQRQVWDSQVTPLGIEAGIFKKHGLEVDITWTAGGAETLQAVLTGSVDYALTNGVEGVLAAYAKGAPVRIVSSEMRGAGDIYWYVKADSPIKSLKDAEGKTMTFSRPGSSSHLTAQQLAAKVGVAPKFVSTGAIRRRARSSSRGRSTSPGPPCRSRSTRSRRASSASWRAAATSPSSTMRASGSTSPPRRS